MTRKQWFVTAAVAALMVSSVAAPSSAGLVQIKLLVPGSGIQDFTLYVPENCGRTEWPDYVISCQDVDPNYEPEAAPVHWVRSPGGRLFRLAKLSANDVMFSGSDSGLDRGHTEDVQQLGATVGGASTISTGTDDDGKVDLVLIGFQNLASWNKFKSGEEGPEVSATWTSIKSRYGD